MPAGMQSISTSVDGATGVIFNRSRDRKTNLSLESLVEVLDF